MNHLNPYEHWARCIEAIGTGEQRFDVKTLPAAVLDKQMLDHNIAELSRMTWGKPIRVVTKSLRSLEVTEYVIKQLGLQCIGVMAYHPREAVLLAEKLPGLSILVAYPCLDGSSLMSVVSALERGADITLMVDSLEQAQMISDLARRRQVEVPLCVDVDMSSRWPGLHFGVHRSSLRTTQQVIALAKAVDQLTGTRFTGVMGYEAQIAGVPDNLPGDALHNLFVPWLKKRSVDHIKRFRSEVVSGLRQAGLSPDLVNGGGTGSVGFTARCPEVTEVSIGSGFYCPHLFDGYRHLKLRPALGFVCQVDRKSDERHVTVGGGGYLASGAAGTSRLPRPIWPNGLQLEKREGAGEVQTPLKGPGAQVLRVGDAVVFRHAKAGELCERFNSLLWIEDGRITRESLTYRGLGWNFI